MSTSEIAKLESRWRENPQGLTFAPLAEAYRKSRDPQRALEVLRVGLEKHPEYIPASIVLGRCHLDLGDDASAESAFRRVLGLDAENVIALKGLSDIAERQSRFDESEGWLRTLLSIDRSNDEARAQLARIEAARNAPSEAPPVAAWSAGSGSLEEDEVDVPATANEPADEPFVDAALSRDELIAPIPLDDAMASDDGGSPERLAADPLAVDAFSAESLSPDPLPADLEAHPLEGLEHTEFAPPAGEVDPVLEIEHEDTVFDPGLAAIEQHDEIELQPSDTSEYQLGSVADDWASTLRPEPESSEFQTSSAADELAAGGESLTAYSRDSWTLPADDELDAAAALSADDEALAAAFAASTERPAEPAAAEPAGDGIADPAIDDDVARYAGEDAGGWDGPAFDDPESVAAFADEAAIDETPAGDPVMADADLVAAGEPSIVEAAAFEPVESVTAGAPARAGDGEHDEDAEDDESASAGGEIETELVVTESMADLYLRQGHRAEALRVYRELHRRQPDDLRLRETVDALEIEEAEAESEPVAADAGERPQYSAPDRSRSVAALFGSVLAARPAEVARAGWEGGVAGEAGVERAAAGESESHPAAPTRPASDHLSLSSVFGDEGSPVPPAVPAPSGEARPDGLSFDDFFEDDEPPEGAKARTPAPREEEDLDQFHAWLQNLKR